MSLVAQPSVPSHAHSLASRLDDSRPVYHHARYIWRLHTAVRTLLACFAPTLHVAEMGFPNFQSAAIASPSAHRQAIIFSKQCVSFDLAGPGLAFQYWQAACSAPAWKILAFPERLSVYARSRLGTVRMSDIQLSTTPGLGTNVLVGCLGWLADWFRCPCPPLEYATPFQAFVLGQASLQVRCSGCSLPLQPLSKHTCRCVYDNLQAGHGSHPGVHSVRNEDRIPVRLVHDVV